MLFRSVAPCALRGPYISEMTTIVLPGERVPAAHVNLKLGPGLTQISKSSPTPPDVRDKPYIVATKAGELKQSANGSKWWVDNNSRRVSSGSSCP